VTRTWARRGRRAGRAGRAIRSPGCDNDVGGGALIYCGSYNRNEYGSAKVLACDWPVDDGIDAYTFALLGYLTGEASYSDSALDYLESWTNPENFNGFDPDGSNAPLQHGWTIPLVRQYGGAPALHLRRLARGA
jgi:hypothetical protein